MVDPRWLYCPFWCEENVWHLLQHDDLRGRPAAAVVVANATRSCALWAQRAASSPSEPVVWDYHVLAVVGGARPEAWDLDSIRLPGSPLADWLLATLPYGDRAPQDLIPRFRVVPAAEYLRVLSSDRRHMRSDDGGWRSPPPSWPAIVRPEAPFALGELLDVSSGIAGTVVEAGGLLSAVQQL